MELLEDVLTPPIACSALALFGLGAAKGYCAAQGVDCASLAVALVGAPLLGGCVTGAFGGSYFRGLTHGGPARKALSYAVGLAGFGGVAVLGGAAAEGLGLGLGYVGGKLLG